MMMYTVLLPWPQQTLLRDGGIFSPAETDLGFQSLRQNSRQPLVTVFALLESNDY